MFGTLINWSLEFVSCLMFVICNFAVFSASNFMELAW